MTNQQIEMFANALIPLINLSDTCSEAAHIAQDELGIEHHASWDVASVALDLLFDKQEELNKAHEFNEYQREFGLN